MEKIKVSVIIPNYNHASYLKQRIDSVLNQTFQNFELIILDDCSTDNSRELIEQYCGNPSITHIIFNKVNTGSTFKQWEKGLQLAKGEYCWIAESDDFAETSLLEKAVAILDKQPSVGIFQVGTNWVNEKNDILFSDSTLIKKGSTPGNDYIKFWMTNGNQIYNASAIVFRKLFVELPLNPFITSFKYSGDWIFWIKIMEKGDHFYLNENLNFFRKNPANTTGIAHSEALFFTEGIRIYGYLKRSGSKHATLFDKDDRFWAFRFAQRNYSTKILLRFFKNSFSAGFLMPAYVLWSYFKLNILKIKTP